MLPDIHSYEDQTTLIMGSGVQFLDFAATFVVKGQSGEFAKMGEAGPLGRLEEDARTGKLHFSFDLQFGTIITLPSGSLLIYISWSPFAI